MNDTKFLRELKTLIFFIRKYGIQHIDFKISGSNFFLNNPDKSNTFYFQCHQGFFAAQDQVVCLLKKILFEQKRLKTSLSEARRQRKKIEENKIEQSLQKAKFQEYVLRKLMDAIAWQLFNYDLSAMRRLYCGEPPIDITNSNLDSELTYIKEYKEEENCGFALISDLTSFIQIGDIVTIDKTNGVRIRELKEGAVNNQIFEIIEDVSKTHCAKHLELALEDKDLKFKKQFDRVVKQIQKSNQVSETIVKGYGSDILTGQNVRIIQGNFEPNTFFKTLLSLSENCHKRGYSISVIEGCLLIGVYDTEKFPSQAFDVWVSEMKIKTPIYDMRTSFFDPLSYPIFLHGFSDNFILDLVSGKKVIKMVLDIEKWLNMFTEDGCNVRWLSSKETSNINSKFKGSNKIFDINGQGIEIEINGFAEVIGHGIFSRIYTSFITPSSAKQLIIEILNQSKEIDSITSQ